MLAGRWKVTAVAERGVGQIYPSKMTTIRATEQYRRSWAVLILAGALAFVSVAVVPRRARAAGTQPPNILLIVMDDVGIDQWQLFG
ncbi:MAG: hypothetical protein WBY93_07465 [Candidatus Binatus sp.]